MAGTAQEACSRAQADPRGVGSAPDAEPGAVGWAALWASVHSPEDENENITSQGGWRVGERRSGLQVVFNKRGAAGGDGTTQP